MHPIARTRAHHRLAAPIIALALLLAAGCSAPPNPILIQQGADALHDGDLARADNRLSIALDRDPANWLALYDMGLVRLRQNRPMEAEFALEKAYNLRPKHDQTPDILDALAESLFQQDKREQLFTTLQQAVSDYGGMRDYLRQARYLAKTGDADDAKLAFKKAIHFARPDDIGPFLEFAEFYDNLGDRQSALHLLRQAYFISPDSKTVAERIRQHDMVPGPTIAIQPER